MSFPETRPTLIQRIAANNGEADWHQFMKDYWRPVCRFAVRWGGLSYDDAEDVASTTFEVLIAKDLLSAWAANPVAKLRSLLCRVVRNVLSNQTRLQRGRQEGRRTNKGSLKNLRSIQWKDDAESPEELDVFFETWVDDVLLEVVDELFRECQSAGRGDVFRVIYGRICEQMPMREIADCLKISKETAYNYFRVGQKLLESFLRRAVQRQVDRYASPAHAAAEFETEWQAMSESLLRRGGLEAALTRFISQEESVELKRREQRSITMILATLSES